MGMFDEIRFEGDLQNLDADLANKRFQTKSLDRLMLNYVIRDRKLYVEQYEWEEVPGQSGFLNFPVMDIKSTSEHFCDITNCVYCYTGNFDYVLIFYHGILVDVKKFTLDDKEFLRDEDIQQAVVEYAINIQYANGPKNDILRFLKAFRYD